MIAPPVTSAKRSAKFAWKTVGKSSRAVCRLDKGRFVACSSPRHYTGLSVGQHTFKLKVRTPAGTTTLQRAWVVTGGPTVTFLTKPASSTTSTEARFTWKASGPVTRTVCRLDNGNYLGCSQPYTVRNLKLGAHSFQVVSWIAGQTATVRTTWTVVKPGGSPPAPPAPPAPRRASGRRRGDPAGRTVRGGDVGRQLPVRERRLRGQHDLSRQPPHTCCAGSPGTPACSRRCTCSSSRAASGSINCPTGQNGYGGGTSGIAQISTYPVKADGTPDTTRLLARTQLTPCAAADSGSVGVPLGLSTAKGQEFATVVQNIDSNPAVNRFSINGLYQSGGLAGANGRNERSPTAKDAYYGLDPRELIGSSLDGGATWQLPAPNYVPTYVQVYADGYRDGQPFLYPTCPCPGAVSGTQTMAFPNVPVAWTISQLGAYTVAASSARVDLLVNDQVVASATLSGSGMLRASITPVTRQPRIDGEGAHDGRAAAVSRCSAWTPTRRGSTGRC